MGIQNRLCGVIVVLSLLSLESGLRADTVQLSSDAPWTGTTYQVNVGHTFTVQVWLSELTTPGGLAALEADVVFDGTFLSGPVGGVVTPGSIVLDATGFLGLPFLESGAFGNYDQYFVDSNLDPSHPDYPLLGPVISAPGDFFKFKLTAIAPGIALISFFDASGSASVPDPDPDGNPVRTNHVNVLLIEVVDPTAVPLPSAVWGGLGLLVVLGITRVRRRPAF